MSTIDTGGPAFPNHPEMPIDAPGEGMTLRDYFAAHAVQGFLTNGHSATAPLEIIAAWSYEMADAMLRARKIDPQQ